MKHIFYFDGNKKKISWAVKTKQIVVKQCRIHANIYLDNVTEEQSKYIALHVGIFWCIGMYIINSNDKIKVMLDLKSMYDYLANKLNIDDVFIQTRIDFIKQLTEQRNIELHYQLIYKYENLAVDI